MSDISTNIEHFWIIFLRSISCGL